MVISSKKLENFELFVLWEYSKKVTASDLDKPGPHIHIIFFESGVTSTCRNGALMLLSLTKKIFPQNHPRPQKT